VIPSKALSNCSVVSSLIMLSIIYLSIRVPLLPSTSNA